MFIAGSEGGQKYTSKEVWNGETNEEHKCMRVILQGSKKASKEPRKCETFQDKIRKKAGKQLRKQA